MNASKKIMTVGGLNDYDFFLLSENDLSDLRNWTISRSHSRSSHEFQIEPAFIDPRFDIVLFTGT